MHLWSREKICSALDCLVKAVQWVTFRTDHKRYLVMVSDMSLRATADDSNWLRRHYRSTRLCSEACCIWVQSRSSPLVMNNNDINKVHKHHHLHLDRHNIPFRAKQYIYITWRGKLEQDMDRGNFASTSPRQRVLNYCRLMWMLWWFWSIESKGIEKSISTSFWQEGAKRACDWMLCSRGCIARWIWQSRCRQCLAFLHAFPCRFPTSLKGCREILEGSA